VSEQRPEPASSDASLVARDLTLGHFTGRDRVFNVAVQELNLDIRRGEFVVIVGPSGCGKSTFLEAAAGLVPTSGGTLAFNGRPITAPGRERSLVFQQASLFPWRDVRGNISYGLDAQHRRSRADRERVEMLIDMVGMRPYVDKSPLELSGGMRQRVNLARALATEPEMILLDEPFGALDALTRETLQEELLRIWQASDADGAKTALFVTHDVTESVLLADRVVVFSPAPAHIAHTVTIDAPRPRDPLWKRSAQFSAYSEELLDALHGTHPTA
jgi:NitT/TauT family transport system ATP-binding protein